MFFDGIGIAVVNDGRLLQLHLFHCFLKMLLYVPRLRSENIQCFWSKNLQSNVFHLKNTPCIFVYFSAKWGEGWLEGNLLLWTTLSRKYYARKLIQRVHINTLNVHNIIVNFKIILTEYFWKFTELSPGENYKASISTVTESGRQSPPTSENFSTSKMRMA